MERAESMTVPDRFQEIVDAGGLVVISHSGGKDSQAMTALLTRRVPLHQVVVVHAPLGAVEWPGTEQHIVDTVPDGVPILWARHGAGKTLLERIEERGQFPDPARRWCTSDFKRGPIQREIRRYLKAHPEYGGLVVDCQGMRAEESPARAKKQTWLPNARGSRAGREWYDWLPIHDLTTAQVFDVIREAGQVPHPAYAQGMTRLSCSFCIMASRADLCTAARLRPDLYAEYVALEKRLGHTLSPSLRYLPEIIQAPASGAVRGSEQAGMTRCG